MIKTNEVIAQKRRIEILESSKKCFSEKGLGHTTMRDIAKEAGLSLGNIYRYFDNKEALIAAFIESDNTEWNEAFDWLDNSKDFSGSLKEIIKEYIKEISTKGVMGIYLDILSESLRNKKIMGLVRRDEGERRLIISLEKAVSDKRIDLTLDPQITALSIMAVAESVALKCMFEDKYSKRLAIKHAYKVIDALVKQVESSA